MVNEALIAETNELLRAYLEHVQEQKEEAARWQEEFSQLQATGFQSSNPGLMSPPAANSGENLETKMNEMQERIRVNAAESLATRERYQEELLAELKVQSDLLRAILERLQR